MLLIFVICLVYTSLPYHIKPASYLKHLCHDLLLLDKVTFFSCKQFLKYMHRIMLLLRILAVHEAFLSIERSHVQTKNSPPGLILPGNSIWFTIGLNWTTLGKSEAAKGVTGSKENSCLKGGPNEKLRREQGDWTFLGSRKQENTNNQKGARNM